MWNAHKFTYFQEITFSSLMTVSKITYLPGRSLNKVLAVEGLMFIEYNYCQYVLDDFRRCFFNLCKTKQKCHW